MTDAELRALVAKATPGPWEVLGAQGTALWAGDSIVASHDSARKMHRMARADAELVVAAVNALPDLLDRLAAAERDAERYQWLFPDNGDSVMARVSHSYRMWDGQSDWHAHIDATRVGK